VKWVIVLALAGCIGPRVEDEDEDDGIVPAGTVLPEAGPELDAKIAAHDQVDGIVPRGSAFGGGAALHVWDLGTAPDFAAPLFVLVRETGPDMYERVDHPPIAGAVPGDAGYSPYWLLFYVEVTDAYRGQLFTDAYALREAEEQGLVEPPTITKQAIDAPIVAAGVQLDVGGAPLAPAGRMIYEGSLVRYFDLGAIATEAGARVADTPRYVVRRDGSEPLNESLRHVDLDGDGDLFDSNDVYAVRAGEAGYTARCRTVEVAVPSSIASIDTSHDEAVADLKDATQLFAPAPVAGTVLAYDVTDEIRHCAQQRTAGGL